MNNNATISATLLLLLLLSGITGCKPQTPAPPASGSGSAAPVPAAPNQPPTTAPTVTPGYEPEYTLVVEPSADGAAATVKWSALVNSGGWTMTTEQVLVEDSMGKTAARVYVILEQPGPEEMVTQSLETLRGEHKADVKVDKAELSIKRIRRGVDTGGFAPLYSIVKQVG